ncbi:MAG: hypothetical protein KAR11_02390 [Phycisphaerae bacterium]|nr:hypothetical protein [Phycisphaerae bacterium]
MKLITLILGYVYCPLLYFTIYLPCIVPRLEGWRQIPPWITWTTVVGFIIVLTALGIRRSHKSICIHAFGIALFLEVFVFAMSRLHMPSFNKSYEAGFLPDAILPILILGIVITVLGEAGRFVAELKRRIFDFNKATEAAS